MSSWLFGLNMIFDTSIADILFHAIRLPSTDQNSTTANTTVNNGTPAGGGQGAATSCETQQFHFQIYGTVTIILGLNQLYTVR